MRIDQLSIKDSVLVAICGGIVSIEEIKKRLLHNYHDQRGLTSKQISNAVYHLLQDGLVRPVYFENKSKRYALTYKGETKLSDFVKSIDYYHWYDDEEDEEMPEEEQKTSTEDGSNDSLGSSHNAAYFAAMDAFRAAMKAYSIAMAAIEKNS